MISERDAHSRDADQRSEEGYLEPIETEIPQVEGHCGDGENKGTDQERTGYPINAIGRNAENHGKKFSKGHRLVDVGRPRITSLFVQV